MLAKYILSILGVSGDIEIAQDDADLFKYLMLVSIGFGGASSIAFFFLVPEISKNSTKVRFF